MTALLSVSYVGLFQGLRHVQCNQLGVRDERDMLVLQTQYTIDTRKSKYSSE